MKFFARLYRNIEKLRRQLFQDTRVKFLFAGGINTLFSYLLYALLVFFGIEPHLAVIIAYPFGILHSYLWHKFFTFRSRGRSVKEMLRFTAISLLGFAVNYWTVYFLIAILSPYIAGVIATAFVTIISYIGHRSFSFRTV